MSDEKKWVMTRREALVATGAALLAACFGDRGELTDAENGDGTLVEMTPNLVFEPETVTIRAGEMVRWRNTSTFEHSATCDPSKASDPTNVGLPEGAAVWDSGLLAGGEEFTHTFDVAGEYRYICQPHEPQAMFGTVIVESS